MDFHNAYQSPSFLWLFRSFLHRWPKATETVTRVKSRNGVTGKFTPSKPILRRQRPDQWSEAGCHLLSGYGKMDDSNYRYRMHAGDGRKMENGRCSNGE